MKQPIHKLGRWLVLPVLCALMLFLPLCAGAQGYECYAEIPVRVELNGDSQEEFHITIERVGGPDATQPLPDEAKDGLWMRGGSHDAFHNLHFTEPGDYLYYVRQTPGDTPYMTYDDALYTVVVQVTNHRTSDGMGLQYQIFASRHDDPSNKVAEVRFLNTYAPPAATPTPAPAGTLPQTGDSLPLGLLVGLAIAAAAAVVVLVVLRRRKK